MKMKKIMFDDRFHLTKAVMEGRKTMTRRILPYSVLESYASYADLYDNVFGSLPCTCDSIEEFFSKRSPYKVGDIVAVARKYMDLYPGGESRMVDGKPLSEHAGWDNKMFVRAELMPVRIVIKEVKVERLQDITDEDCLREGIFRAGGEYGPLSTIRYDYHGNKGGGFATPREAFASLIDKVCGKGTWDYDPFVWVFGFSVLRKEERP